MKNYTEKNRAPAPGDEFLTTEEAAKRRKRFTKTLEYWRTAALGPPFYRQQRSVRYLASGGDGLGSQLPCRPPEHRGLKLMKRQAVSFEPEVFTISRELAKASVAWGEALNRLTL